MRLELSFRSRVPVDARPEQYRPVLEAKLLPDIPRKVRYFQADGLPVRPARDSGRDAVVNHWTAYDQQFLNDPLRLLNFTRSREPVKSPACRKANILKYGTELAKLYCESSYAHNRFGRY